MRLEREDCARLGEPTKEYRPLLGQCPFSDARNLSQITKPFAAACATKV